jgi:tetratricopeptide (TPR) repeat protein
MRQRNVISFLTIFSWIAITPGLFAFAQGKKTFYAYSMRVAQARVEQAVKQGIDWRKKQPDLFYLGGITKPLAVVLDTRNNDWILVGERDPKSSVLTLDDWVTALLARFIHGDRDPGVTIDPLCPQGTIKEGCRNNTRQEVRFFGGIENTHFGQVCYEADWLMKRIGLGLEQLPIDKLETYYKLSLDQQRRSGGGRANVRSRFWFYPIVNRVNVFGDVVLLEKFQMGIFTEVLHAELDGKPVADVTSFEHYPSEGFSRSLSENYDAAAEAREVLETLRGLTRLAALAKGLTEVEIKPSIGYFLTEYAQEEAKTPKEVEVLNVKNQEAGLEISGGVSLMALAMRLKGGDASALKGLVMGVRPSNEALNWGVEIEIRAGQVAGVRLPSDLADPSQLASIFAQAMFLYQKKRYDAAIEGYGEAVRLNPNLAEIYNNRGNAYADKHDYDKALADYDKALTLKPNLAEAYNNRGLAYSKKGDYDRAIVDYNKGISLNPNDIIIYNNRGIAYKNKGEYDKAIADFDKAIAINPNDDDAYGYRGIAYKNKSEFDKAIADFDKAIALNPNNTEAYSDRGSVYADKREFDKAIADFDKAISINPNYADAYFNRGIAYHRKGADDKAIADFDKAISLNPNDAEIYNNRGSVYAEKHNYDAAIADFDKAIALNSSDAMAYFNRGLAYSNRRGIGKIGSGLVVTAGAYANKRDYDKAIADFDKAIALNPSYPSVYYNRGIAHAGKGNYDKAILDFDKSIALNPNHFEAYYNRGVILHFYKHDYDKAIVDYDKAITLNRNHTITYNNRGVIYVEKGDYDKAVAEFSEAITLDPNYSNAYINRGAAYAEKGDYDKAMVDYNKAITLNPSHDKVYNNRANAWFMKKNYDKAWADIEQYRKLGGVPNSNFLESLRKASGKHGEKVIKSYINPAYSKLDKNTCPVIHLNYPRGLAMNIKPKSPPGFEKGSVFRLDPDMKNEVCLPEGLYEILFDGPYLFMKSILGNANIRIETSHDGRNVGPLHLEVNARRGEHYYFFAPPEFIAYKDDMLSILDQQDSFIKEGIFGALKVCGIASSRRLTDEEEYDARNKAKFSALSCDFFDTEKFSLGKKRTEPAPLIVEESASTDPNIQADILYWSSIREKTDPESQRLYLTRFPKGIFADQARAKILLAEEKIEKSKGPATVHIYQTVGGGGLGKANIYLDEKIIARLGDGRYFSIRLDAGRYTFNVSKPDQGTLILDIVGGQEYYVQNRQGWTHEERLFLIENFKGISEMQELKPLEDKFIVDHQRIVKP